jgi:hypothetical protein
MVRIFAQNDNDMPFIWKKMICKGVTLFMKTTINTKIYIINYII